MNYTIERLRKFEDFDKEMVEFLLSEGVALSKITGQKFNWRNFNALDYARNAIFWVARRDGAPVGMLLARLYGSVFDNQTKILFQDLLYVKPGNRKAAFLLFQQYIDFGKLNANHILTAAHDGTNIKARSFARLGFKKMEVVYRLEIKK